MMRLSSMNPDNDGVEAPLPWRMHEGTYTHWAGHEARHLVINDGRGCIVATVPLGLSMSDEMAWNIGRLIVDALRLAEVNAELLAICDETDRLLFQVLEWMFDHGGMGTQLRVNAKAHRTAIGAAIAKAKKLEDPMPEQSTDPPREVEPSTGMKLANSAVHFWQLACPELHDEGKLDCNAVQVWKGILRLMETLIEQADQ